MEVTRVYTNVGAYHIGLLMLPIASSVPSECYLYHETRRPCQTMRLALLDGVCLRLVEMQAYLRIISNFHLK